MRIGYRINNKESRTENLHDSGFLITCLQNRSRTHNAKIRARFSSEPLGSRSAHDAVSVHPGLPGCHQWYGASRGRAEVASDPTRGERRGLVIAPEVLTIVKTFLFGAERHWRFF